MIRNPKFDLVNPPTGATEEKTIIVIGLGRSGTTLVASILSYLGIFLGDRANTAFMEDMRLTEPVESNEIQKVREVIADYNSKHKIWAYKRPSMLLFAGRLNQEFRNPRYIFVHRDFFSIALRNRISISRDINISIAKCMKAYESVFALMKTVEAPSLHLSYELLLLDKVESANVIRDFIFDGSKVPAIDSTHLKNLLNERHKAYLEASN
jgi:hypothetical protein